MNNVEDVFSSAEINTGENTNSEVIEEIEDGENVRNSKEFPEKDTFHDDVTLRPDASEVALASLRRVSFPKSDSELVTGYLEPANPWESVSVVKTVSELSELYTMSCKKHNTEPLKSVLDHLQSLELSKSMRQSCLSLKNNNLTPDSCEALEEILKRVQYEVIDLSECQLNDTAASALFDMIEYYEAANALDISGNPDISSRGLQSCISMIRRSRALQTITIRGSPLSEANASNLGKSLNNSFLHTIKLEHCGLTGRPIAALCNALKKNNTLKELSLAHNDLGPNDAERLAELLRSNGYLVFLDIRNNSIKDLGVRYIVKALIEQSTNIEEDSSKSKRDTAELLSENNSTPVRNVNSGRSMLGTLLSMNSKLPTVEVEKIDDDGWDFGQTETKKYHNEPKVSEGIFPPFGEGNQACSNRCGVNSVGELEQVSDTNSPIKQNPVISTNNNEYSTCDVSHVETKEGAQTKALDFNKNTKIDEMETSSDSAFESASEGDTRFKETPKMNNFKQMEFETGLYTKDAIVNNENLSDSGVAFSESRLRSLSSDSLSSDNSLDTSDTSLLDKINEKITKNDTLTRQKHVEEPPMCTEKPKGLRALILWNNNITRESGEFISDLLATTNSLELLNIGKNILSNDFIAKIGESLKNNSTLTNLGLQSAHLSCTGIKTLSSVLQFGGNSTLERIDIRDNNLQVEGLSALVEALKSNKSVTQVDVDDVPKRISDGANDNQFSYVLQNLRTLCSRNGSSKESATLTNNVKRTGKYLTSRKISLTCPSIRTPLLDPPLKTDQLSVDIKKKSSVRLRSPLPSPPTASPSSSPVPSPSRSRFQVFRVVENKTPPSPDSNILQKEVPKFSFKSRFHVTIVKSAENTDSHVTEIKSSESNSGKLFETSPAKESPTIGVDVLNQENTKEEASTKNLIHSVGTHQNVASSYDSTISDLKDELRINADLMDNPSQMSLEESRDSSEAIVSPNLETKPLNTTDVLSDQTSLVSSVSTPAEENQKSSETSTDIGTSENAEVSLTIESRTNVSVNSRVVFCESSLFTSSEMADIEKRCASSDSVAQTTLNQSAVTVDLGENKKSLEDDPLPAVSDNNKFALAETSNITTSTDVINDDTMILEECLNSADSGIDTEKLSSTIGESANDQTKQCESPQEGLESKTESVKTETEPRVRKSSWISNTGCPTTVDKLLSLFQHPAHLFARTSSPEREKKVDDSDTASQSLVSVRKQSPPSGLFSWHKSSTDPKISDVKRLSSDNIINSSFQASFLDVASKQIRGIADFGKQVFRQNIAFGDTVNVEPPQSCESIPTEVKLEIKENISPEHTITPNSIAFLQTIQQGNKTATSVQSDNEDNSQSVHPTSAQSGGKVAYDPDLGDLKSSDITGNNL